MGMFCYQCEQAAKGTGCDVSGVCGKQPSTSSFQDLLIFQLKGIGYLAHEARKVGVVDETVNKFSMEALFTTVTNVNFDDVRLVEWIKTASQLRDGLATKYRAAAKAKNVTIDESQWPIASVFTPDSNLEALLVQAQGVTILSDDTNEDIRSLKHLLVYGLKGLAAYAEHAYLLGEKDDSIFAYIQEALSELNRTNLDIPRLVELNMQCGTVNIRTMEILDKANTTHYGHPQPTPVSTALKAGPAIIVTGHDLLDLENLLKQTEGTGVNIYTHGEMLPALGYPGLKKYKHLVGHFGTAWQNQQKEFDNIPAAILFTTNCIQKPKDSYKDRVFTTGLVAFPGISHVKNGDFASVIQKAKALGGFKETAGGMLMTGFARNAVLGVADKVIDAVKSGAIRHFFLVGGCDGAKPGRNYYTELVESIPKDCVVMTLACGKFRFNHLDLGDIGGIPRLLDVGQCNDAYSAIEIAKALAGAFNCGVNDLPLSMVLSWYEQKAVVILLSLLSLGIKGIRLGPTLPAFITPNILSFLVKTFDIKPITNAKDDLEAILGTAVEAKE